MSPIMSKNTLIFIIIIISIILDSNRLTASNIFSSLIRNNLNRYLKNPLFTRSFVKNSLWQSEFDEHGSLIVPQMDNFIKSNGQFSVDDHHHLAMESFDGQTFPSFDLPNGVNDFLPSSKLPPPPPPSSSSSPSSMSEQSKQNVRFPTEKSLNNDGLDGENKLNRIHSTNSLTTTNNNNAYSSFKKIPQQQQLSNQYVNEDMAESIKKINYQNPAITSINNRQRKANNKYNNHNYYYHKQMKKIANGKNNNYNQEKALNLKLEYGFKPLPGGKKDLSTNSIQMNDPIETDEQTEDDRQHDDYGDDNDGLFQGLFSFNNRTMKSLEASGTNRLEEPFSHDYKKYISYPMETESSDNIHKLAFTDIESFRPDHGFLHTQSFLANSYGLPVFETISNYPNIKNFRKQGIECARQAGYCEYDSSYPIDYVNSIITNCTSIIDDMYAEMPENMDDFSGYKSLFHVHSAQTNSFDSNAVNPSPTGKATNGSLCDADRKYIRPSVIKDIHNVYHLILQSSFYFQQIPVEICSNPDHSCNYISECNNQKLVRVKCRQKYRTHILISIEHNEHEKIGNNLNHQFDTTLHKAINCPKMRMYRLPSSCVCELSND
ncbi:uncharacterized protein LOC113796724 [Dermatophagoides pteronyssinus]|uniref:uncharacterized protein LOC113796724 n=1 Tax=Dermatophagoides pteronyssinus TaxID=6956 RepID=UPI003F66ADAA